MVSFQRTFLWCVIVLRMFYRCNTIKKSSFHVRYQFNMGERSCIFFFGIPVCNLWANFAAHDVLEGRMARLVASKARFMIERNGVGDKLYKIVNTILLL